MINDQEVARCRARGAVYCALAEALTDPYPGMQTVFTATVLSAAAVGGSAICRQAAAYLIDLPIYAHKQVQESFRRTLHGSAGRPPSLYESLHRQGHLAGDLTHAVGQIYRKMGLEVPAINGQPDLPDHASVELSFLGCLAEAEAEAWQADERQLVHRLHVERRSFLQNHAAVWLPELGLNLTAAAAGQAQPIYATVGLLLQSFLREELVEHRRPESKAGRLPHLSESDACTLCGLCIGSCPTNALRMAESRSETALMLETSLCISCRRCVRICPEQVLALSAEDGAWADDGEMQIMRTSQRVACPICGTPTVSQAELSAVFTRLDADPELQAVLSLCEGCKGTI